MKCTWNFDEIKNDELMLSAMIEHHTPPKSSFFDRFKRIDYASVLLSDLYYLSQFPFMEKYAKLSKKDILDANRIDIRPTQEFSAKKTLSLVYDFYKETLKDFPLEKEIFLREFNNRNNCLRFIRPQSYYEFGGVTYYSMILNKTYAEIVYNKNLYDAISLVHEYGHVISMNKHESYHTNELSEIESTFYQMLFLEYLKNYPKYDVDTQIFKRSVWTQYERSLIVIHNRFKYRDCLLNLCSEYGSYDVPKKEMIPYISMNTSLSEEQIKADLNYQIQNYFQYTLGFLYNFELVKLFETDQNKAMEIYNLIVDESYKDSIDYINLNNKVKKLGLTPTKNDQMYHLPNK